MFIESLHRNWPLLHSQSFLPPFCDFTWLLSKSLFVTLPLENLDEIQRCSELLYRDGLRYHTCWILLHDDFYQIDHLIIHDPLMYISCDTSHQCVSSACDICDLYRDESHSGYRNEFELNPV